MIVNIRNKSLVLLLISAMFYQSHGAGKNCGQITDPQSGEVSIKDNSCLGDLNSIVNTACDTFQQNLPQDKYNNLCKNQSVLKANSSQGWQSSLDALNELLKSNLSPIKQKRLIPEVEKLTKAYETYFKPYLGEFAESKTGTSKLGSFRKNPMSTAVVEVKSVEIQTELDINDLDRQYIIIEEQLKEIEKLSKERAELEKKVANLEKNTSKEKKSFEVKETTYKETIEKLEIKITQKLEEIAKIKESMRLANRENAQLTRDQEITILQLEGDIKKDKRQIDELKSNLEKAQQENRDIKQRLNTQDAEHKNQNVKAAELRAELENNNTKLQKIINELQGSLEKQQIELDSRAYTIAEGQRTQKVLELHNQKYQENINALDTDIKNKNQEILKIKKENLSQKAAHDKSSRAKDLEHHKEIAKHIHLNAEMQDMVSKLTFISKTAHDENSQLKSQVSQLLIQIKDNDVSSARLTQQISDLKKKVEECKANIASLKKELAEEKQAFEQARAKWEQESTEATQILLNAVQNSNGEDASERGIKAVENALDQKKDLLEAAHIAGEKIEDLSRNVKQKNEEIATLSKNKENEKNKLENEIKSLTDKSTQEIQRKTEEIKKISQLNNQEKKKLQEEIEALNIRYLNKIEEKNKDIERISQSYDQEKKSLETQIVALNKAQKDLGQEKRDIEQKAKDLNLENEKLMQAMTAQEDKHNKEMQQTIANSDKTQEEKKLLQSEIAENKQIFNEIMNKFKELETSNITTVDTLAKTLEALETRRKAMSRLNRQLVVAKGKVKQTQASNANFQQESKEKDMIIEVLQKNKRLQQLEQEFPNISLKDNPHTFSERLNNLRVRLIDYLRNSTPELEEKLYNDYINTLTYIKGIQDVRLVDEFPKDLLVNNYLTDKHQSDIKRLFKDVKDASSERKSPSVSEKLNSLRNEISEQYFGGKKFSLIQQFYVTQRDFSPSSVDLESTKQIYLDMAIQWLSAPNLSEVDHAEQKKVLFEEGPEELKTLVKSHQDDVQKVAAHQYAEMEKIKKDLDSEKIDLQDSNRLYYRVVKLTQAYDTLKDMNTETVQAYAQGLLGQIKTTYQQLLDAVLNGTDVTTVQLEALQTVNFPEVLLNEKRAMYNETSKNYHDHQKHEIMQKAREEAQKEITIRQVDELRANINSQPMTVDQVTENLVNLYKIYDKMLAHETWFTPEERSEIIHELSDSYSSKINLTVQAHENRIISEDIILSSTSFNDNAPQEIKDLAEQARHYIIEHNNTIQQHMTQQDAHTRQKIIEEHNEIVNSLKAEHDAFYQNTLQRYQTHLDRQNQEYALALQNMEQQYQNALSSHNTQAAAELNSQIEYYRNEKTQLAHQYNIAFQEEIKNNAHNTVAKLIAPFVPNPESIAVFASSLQSAREAYREMNRNLEYFTNFEINEMKERIVSYYKVYLLKYINNYKNVQIPEEVYSILNIDTTGLPQESISEITTFQEDMQTYVQKHNESERDKNVEQLFKTDLEFLEEGVSKNLTQSSFASLVVSLQRLYDISELCADYTQRFPNFVEYFTKYKVDAEAKFAEGYKLMLKCAEEIYEKVAPVMFKKDEEAIRNIAVPKPLEAEIHQYLNEFFQKVYSHSIELENNTGHAESIVEEKKEYLQSPGSKAYPIDIDSMDIEKDHDLELIELE